MADGDCVGTVVQKVPGLVITAEFKDVAGILDSGITLERTVIFEGSTTRMLIGIASRNIEIIEDARLFNQIGWNFHL